MGTDTEEQLKNFSHNIQEFMECIESLPEHQYLEKIDEWTPRDITAHLVGWNLCTIEGCQQIKKGEIPYYLIDPGDDFCKFNASLVQKYNSKNKSELLSQLNDSAEKLRGYMNSLDPVDWETDFGVNYEGETVTIKNTIDALISDFVNHRQQVTTRAAKRRAKGGNR